MTERITFEKAANGMPKCPKCGQTMHWESDWNADEVLDIDEEGLYPDDVVSSYSCPGCDTMYYTFIENGEMVGFEIISDEEA